MTNFTMAMGWWHPYFFSDTSGVQVLFSFLEINGPASLVAALGAIFTLCLVDRYAAAGVQSARGTSSYIPLFFLQRLSGGLVMLVLMSFNIVLFVFTLVFLSLCEYVVQKRARSNDTLRTYEMAVTTG
mmetsp:Transcript_18866/g.37549  ORF Transcript_18866/g.37549 Transcript_18866/m.37549 type:complete len:128 (-) Transcript_18866:97-480(-)